MIPNELAPAIGGLLLGGGLVTYVLYLRHRLHAEQRAEAERVKVRDR